MFRRYFTTFDFSELVESSVGQMNQKPVSGLQFWRDSKRKSKNYFDILS